MILSDIAVKRPTIAIVANLLLVVFGIVAFDLVPLRQYPDIDPPVVSIVTTYPGSSADIVDTKITRILEEQLSGIDGIKFIDSVSRDGSSTITIEFEVSRDVEAAVNDVQQSIGRSLNRLPDEVDLPRVSKADSNASPIMWFNLVSDSWNQLEMSDYARRVIVDRLSVVDGVARVVVGGERNYAMRIYLDRRAMAARNITANDVEDALRAENVELPAGIVRSETRDFTARINPVYKTPEDFANLVVARGANGHLVRLGEVADVGLGAENDETMFRRDGVPMVGLGIVKQSQANTVDVADRTREAIELLRHSLPPELEIRENYDSSVFIKSSINEVYKTLGIAVILVVLVIYAFLGSARATLIPGVTVPICLVASAIFIYAMGFSINILTLLALVLGIGLVVDDAIVVLENIYRRIEKGEPALLAAYNGTREVGFAVVATTAVLVAVFVPLVFLEGNVGRLFTEFALTLVAAVVFSSFVALTLSPVMCSKLLKRSAEKGTSSLMEGALDRLEDAYERVLRGSKRGFVYSVAALVISAGAIAVLFWAVPGEFAPEEDNGSMILMFRGPEGSSFDRTRDTMLEIEAVMQKHYAEFGMDRMLLRVPSFGGGQGVNTGTGIMGFYPWEQRSESTMDVRPAIYEALNQVPDGRIFVFTASVLAGSGMGQPVQAVIGADTYEELGELREVILEKLQGNPVLRNIDIDYVVNTQQLMINVDQQRAADLGVSVANVGRTLETILGSRQVTTYIREGEEYNVMLEGQEADYGSPDSLANIYVRSDRSGELIPLASLVTVEERAVAPSLPRFNRRRALTLSADIAPGHTMDAALQVVQDLVQNELPSTTTIDYKGESLEYIRASGSIIFVFFVALLVAYLVMAAQFESFLHPLLIMFTVPLAVIGALAGLFFTGQTLNIFSQIGLVMLIGLAAKNGILIVEFANQLRDRGVEFSEAVYQASRRRLRPILMTSLTTILGAVPLLTASGAGAEVRFVLGVVIFFGVFSSTLLTLFILPSLYLALAKRSNTPGKVARTMRALEDQG
ncbi:MAG: efflux RND transporter permease subunit [Porticoccaceae bacterium]